MLITHQHPLNKSLVVSVMGVPNAGKSTLVNNLLGMDLSIVTPKEQTTRNKFQCAFTIDRTEIVLVDTPGIHSSSKELNKRMNQQAVDSREGSDLLLVLLDVSRDILRQIQEFTEIFEKNTLEIWVLFTKCDLLEKKDFSLKSMKEKLLPLIPKLTNLFLLSPKTGENVHLLIGALEDRAPSAPHLFHDGSLSNKSERFFVGEYIREQAFAVLNEELPYELAVVVESFKDMREQESEVKAYISAVIYVNRPSQRPIVVGSRGSVIKEIGVRARSRIEEMIGGKIHLNLHVKVVSKWFKNNAILESLDLPRAHNSTRIWRKR